MATVLQEKPEVKRKFGKTNKFCQQDVCPNVQHMKLPACQSLLIDVAEDFATITLNRPERLNAYTVTMGAELSGALRALERAGETRAVAITGAGRAFCAGMDLDGGDTFAREGQFEQTRALVRARGLRVPDK